jgi:hypothetical protein
MSKGNVYGGVLHLPAHPAADIHGLVRAIMRTRNQQFVNTALGGLGVQGPAALWREHIWCESGSAIERLVTESNYGVLMVCPLVSMYVKADAYQKLDERYFTRCKTA